MRGPIRAHTGSGPFGPKIALAIEAELRGAQGPGPHTPWVDWAPNPQWPHVQGEAVSSVTYQLLTPWVDIRARNERFQMTVTLISGFTFPVI